MEQTLHNAFKRFWAAMPQSATESTAMFSVSGPRGRRVSA